MVKDVTWRLTVDSALGLANTIHGPGGHRARRARPGEADHDHLADPTDAWAFLVGHDVPDPTVAPTAPQLARLRTIRALIRVLADRPVGGLDRWRSSIDAALTGATFRLTAERGLYSTATGWDGIADDLLPAALMLADERERIRICGNPRCRWQFVDRSRNASRIWCEMAVCGNRVKVGRHRLAARSEAVAQPPR